ncbi:phosphotransferase [Tistrella bauzanensis]|uniref:Phosphotransferase n=1 Tax=Tistrella arctica TaxID=3133430 RepID=A0ABU9YSQ4_9PROT
MSGPNLVPVREALRLDEAALSAYLTGRLPELDPADLRILQFEGGQSNPTYLLESAGRRYVLRKKPPGKLLPSAHMVEREYRFIAGLADSDVPVPRAYLLCEDTDVIGTAFYVMDYVEGRVLTDPLLPGLSPAERGATYDELNRVMAALHKVDFAAAGLSDMGKTSDYLARQISRWSRQYEASKTHEIPAMDKLIAWLGANIPADDSVSIVHGDFRLANVIFHPTEPKILAVLDWELATLGHPLGDFAYNAMFYSLPAGDEGFPGLGGADLAALGVPGEDAYVAAYCRRTGRDHIDNWAFYKAFAMFRLSAILQGVYHRGISGNASSERARLVGGRAALLAELGWRQVSGD